MINHNLANIEIVVASLIGMPIDTKHPIIMPSLTPNPAGKKNANMPNVVDRGKAKPAIIEISGSNDLSKKE